MIHQSALKYRNARYLWWALGLMLASIALYVTQGGFRAASGGTWQGYTLGTVGALLIGWLSLLGVRKRAYKSASGSVAGWTSAHIYLGATLILVATLHCAGQFGWNVHTLAYVLMIIVIFSGFVGVYTYINLPTQLAANSSGGGGRAELFAELYDLNKRLLTLAQRADLSIQTAVTSSIERTVIGGGVTAQLFGVDNSRFVRQSGGAAQLVANADQQAAIDFVGERLPRADRASEVPQLQQLVNNMSRRQSVLRRIRRDIRLSGWLQFWLYIHVPVTIALLVALVLHIIVTFMYW
jgi:hypothetical protein